MNTQPKAPCFKRAETTDGNTRGGSQKGRESVRERERETAVTRDKGREERFSSGTAEHLNPTGLQTDEGTPVALDRRISFSAGFMGTTAAFLPLLMATA